MISRRAVSRWSLCLALFISMGTGSAVAAADVAVLAGDGAVLRGVVTSDGKNLNVGLAAVALERVVAARFAGAATTVDQGVVLVDGDVLAGVVVSMQNGQLEFASDRFGNRSLPLSAVSALVLAPQTSTELVRVSDEPAGARFINGDRLGGSLTFLNPVAAGINNGKRIVELPRERLALLRTATPSPAATPGALQRVRLVTGERISGTLTKLDATTLTLKHAVLGNLALPVALVATLWSEGGALSSLIALPATVTQVGFLGAAAAPRANGATNDGPMAVLSGNAEHVLLVHARSELTYALDGTSDLLVGEVALEARGVGRGDAVVRVLGDGKTLAEIALADGASHVLNVPLTGVRQLTLVTDVGPDGTTTGDLVTWCWPVLVRGLPTAAR